MIGTWLNSVLKCYAQYRLKCVYISDAIKIDVRMGMAKYKKPGDTHIKRTRVFVANFKQNS